MEGSNVELSDSDSGESWTMLDNTPSHADKTPEFPELPPTAEHEGETLEHTDKDDDTDGISIISDSEADSITSCEHVTPEQVAAECSECLADQQTSQYNSGNSQISNELGNLEQSIRPEDDDLLGDNSTKMRTYVHRRNKRLSTVLNIIVLGSLITAAGVAIGHMWGAEECAPPATGAAVNKILSNLYKLQEENAYLRSKLKELTLANNILSQQQKAETEKLKQFNKKGFGEGFINSDNQPKCDFDDCSTDRVLDSHLVEPEFEKDFLSDLDKLKTVYKQNRSWLDEEVARRQKYEKVSIKKLKIMKKNKKTLNNKSESSDNPVPDEPVTLEKTKQLNDSERKISYADSLKSDKNHGNRKKRHTSEHSDNIKEQPKKKKLKRQLAVISEWTSDDEIKKDDRYASPQYKADKKKNRQKTNKKQKRRNKYEQWEMNGGYMKDYDDVSIASSQDIDPAPKASNNFVMVGSNSCEGKNGKDVQESEKRNGNWYVKRVVLRSEARRRVAQEMFGAGGGAAGAGGAGGRGAGSGWYFRRVRHRQQRGDAGNVRRDMNYKTKL